ncbi:MAG: adenylate kinase family protein [Haloarculaceae archaeon]
MRVAVTGTPGTGKTTASDLVDSDLEVIHLNDVIKTEGFDRGRDAERDTLIADMDAVADWLGVRDDVLVESHLAHHLPADRVVVLRCHPEELERRLGERGESAETAAENAESEALDLILSEAVADHGLESVYEIDATERSPESIAAEIEAVIAGEREPSAGEVSYLEYL